MNADRIRAQWDEDGYWLILDADEGTFQFRCDVLELREVVARSTDGWVDEMEDARATYRGARLAGFFHQGDGSSDGWRA